jgi:hypothetical protein
MPTKQFEPVLYRELRRVEAKKMIEVASPLLQEEVNYATHAFQRCQDSIKGVSKDEALPILVSYHHVIGMTDGVEVLISQSCIVPAIALLRSLFEALLTIEYICKKDSKNRAFAWLVCYVHNRIKQHELFDSSSQKGKEFIKALENDGLDKNFNISVNFDAKKAITNLLSLFNRPEYQIVENEYQRIKDARKSDINWYSLFNGPSNLRELSKYLNRWSDYDLLYRYWSNIIHVGALSHFLTRTKNGSPAFKPIRNHEELILIVKMTSLYIVAATQVMLNKCHPGEDKSFGKWYITEIRAKYEDFFNYKISS